MNQVSNYGRNAYGPVDQDLFIYLAKFANAIATGRMPYPQDASRPIEERIVSAVTHELGQVAKHLSEEQRAGYCLRLVAIPAALNAMADMTGRDFRAVDGTALVPDAFLKAVAVARFKDFEALDENDLLTNFERSAADGGVGVGLGRVLTTTICKF